MKVGITCSVLTFKTITKRQFVVKDVPVNFDFLLTGLKINLLSNHIYKQDF